MSDNIKMNINIDTYMKKVKFMNNKKINENIDFMKGINDKEMISFIVYFIYINMVKVRDNHVVKFSRLVDDQHKNDTFNEFSRNPFKYVVYCMESVFTAAISREVKIDMDLAHPVFDKGKEIYENLFELSRYVAIYDIIGMEKILPTILRFIIDLTTNDQIVSENIGWKDIFYLLDLYINNLDKFYE